MDPGTWSLELNLADSLLEYGFDYDAATEYQRFLFTHPGDSRARCGLVRAYAASGDLDRAEALLLSLPGVDDSLGWRARFALALGYLEHERPGRARAEFTDLLTVTRDTLRQQELRRRLGWLELDDGSFRPAATHFALAGDSALAAECRRIDAFPRKSPELATLFSSLIPGSGELYAGSLKLGLTSLAVQGAVAAGVLYSLHGKYYLDAALLFSLLWTRFYFGSRDNARNCTEDYNLRLQQQAIREIRRRFGPETGKGTKHSQTRKWNR